MTSPPRSLQARNDQWVEKIGTQSRLILLSLLRRRQANGLDTSISMFFQMSTTSTNAYGNRWEIMWKQVHENDGLVSNIRMSGVFPSAAPCRYEMWQVKRKHLEHTSRTHRNLFLFLNKKKGSFVSFRLKRNCHLFLLLLLRSTSTTDIISLSIVNGATMRSPVRRRCRRFFSFLYKELETTQFRPGVGRLPST